MFNETVLFQIKETEYATFAVYKYEVLQVNG